MGRYGRVGWFRSPGAADRAAAVDALSRVGMAEYRDRQISRLSGGQQQRTFLALALVQDADLYMMDEPFACVDVVTERAIVAYDLRDRDNPREASKLVLDSAFPGPHWIAADPVGSRIVVTAEEGWVLLLRVDTATGALTIDQGFRDEGADRHGVTFDRAEWPHGTTGRAVPHGAVFGNAR